MKSLLSALLAGVVLVGWGLPPAEASPDKEGTKDSTKVVKEGEKNPTKVVKNGAKAPGAKATKKPKKTPEQVFQKRDQDGDDTLTLQEFEGKKPRPKAEARFKKLDQNADGKLSLDEFNIRSKGKGKGKKTTS